MGTNTFIVRIPSADVPQDLKGEIEGVLTELAPLVSARIKEKRQHRLQVTARRLLRGVKLRTLDIHRAQQQAKALEAVLENSEWLTAEEIGERGKFSPSNLAAPANRWKQEGKIFCRSIPGSRSISEIWPGRGISAYPGLEPVLKLFGPISPWRIAVWFESANAWLEGHRPRELLGKRPGQSATRHERYRNAGHG